MGLEEASEEISWLASDVVLLDGSKSHVWG
jgi:hypothetical protein